MMQENGIEQEKLVNQVKDELRMKQIKDKVFGKLFQKRENQLQLLLHILPNMTQEEKENFQVLTMLGQDLDKECILGFLVSGQTYIVGETPFLESKAVLVDLYYWHLKYMDQYEMLIKPVFGEGQLPFLRWPKYYVLYTGNKELGYTTISYDYIHQDNHMMHTLNKGEILSDEGEDVLGQYLFFCHCLDNWDREGQGMERLKEALRNAIHKCMVNEVLPDFFSEHEEELFEGFSYS